jgi:hypothetical protein
MEDSKFESSIDVIKEIIRLADMIGWTFSTLEPEDKTVKVEGMVIGTPNFCTDAITIITNVLNRINTQPQLLSTEEEGCTIEEFSKTSESDDEPSDNETAN